MMESYLTRQWDLLPPEKTKMKISIMGAGAIGSQVAVCLSKMGFTDLIVFDFDTVDEENMNNQWYGPEDIGEMKVEALKKQIKRMTGAEMEACFLLGDKDTPDFQEQIIVSAVDSMKARVNIYERAKRLYKCDWFIDPRMSAEKGAIYVVNLRDETSKSKYEKSLYSDEEATSEACTAKATMYCSMLLSGQVCKTIKDIAVSEAPMKKCFWDVRKNAIMFM